MEHEYAWVLTTADADPDVRVVVITGAGRGFCAGADVKALDRISEAGDYDDATPAPPEEAPVLETGEVHLLPSRPLFPSRQNAGTTMGCRAACAAMPWLVGQRRR